MSYPLEHRKLFIHLMNIYFTYYNPDSVLHAKSFKPTCTVSVKSVPAEFQSGQNFQINILKMAILGLLAFSVLFFSASIYHVRCLFKINSFKSVSLP